MKSLTSKNNLYTVLAILITTIVVGLIYSATKTHIEIKKEVVSYGYKRTDDPNLAVGMVTVTQKGKDGEKTTVLEVNNWFHSIQTVKSSDLTIQPVDQIAIVGTKKAPSAADKILEKSNRTIEEVRQCINNPKLCSNSTTSSSGYDAGYQWAYDNNICDTNYSNGNSDDFNRGVQDWANDNCTN